MLILLVEDNLDLAELIIEHFEDEGHDCDVAYHGEMALSLVQDNHYDVIVTDIMMPKMNGIELTHQLQQKGIATPILMLTAKDSLQDKLNGFEVGAQDYLVKPFDLEELSARVSVLAKRQLNMTSLIQIDDLVINLQKCTAIRSEQELSLSPNEWKLLEILARKSPEIVSKNEIVKQLWGEAEQTDDAFKMLVYRLRKSIDAHSESKLVHTIRGKGVRLSNDG